MLTREFYFLSPVQVVKVTSKNMEEVAEWCGGKVAITESRKVEGRMDPYVWVPTPKGTHISWAFPGMFVTKRVVATVKGDLKVTWAVFNRNYFENNYFATPLEAVDATWTRAEQEEAAKLPQIKEPTAGVEINITGTGINPQRVAEAVAEASRPKPCPPKSVTR